MPHLQERLCDVKLQTVLHCAILPCIQHRLSIVDCHQNSKMIVSWQDRVWISTTVALNTRWYANTNNLIGLQFFTNVMYLGDGETIDGCQQRCCWFWQQFESFGRNVPSHNSPVLIQHLCCNSSLDPKMEKNGKSSIKSALSDQNSKEQNGGSGDHFWNENCLLK